MPKKSIEDVLTQDALIAMREEGLSYKEIAATVEFHESTVAAYGRRTLPAHIQGYVKPRGPNKGNTPKEGPPKCRKCTMVKGNYWRPISAELGLCLWCALKMFGIDVDKVRENGLGYQVRRIAELEAEVERLRAITSR